MRIVFGIFAQRLAVAIRVGSDWNIVEIAVLIDSEPLAPDEIPFAVIDQDMLAVNALAACQVMGEIQAVDFSVQLDSDYGGDRR
jgi:hypothetical protein